MDFIEFPRKTLGFEGKTYPKLLTDNDNSEDLRLKFLLPENIKLEHKSESNWQPVNQIIKDNKLCQ